MTRSSSHPHEKTSAREKDRSREQWSIRRARRLDRLQLVERRLQRAKQFLTAAGVRSLRVLALALKIFFQLLKLIDLDAIAKIARKRKLISVSDNTFATPWIQRPIESGFDIVVHSATKYLNGHSDLVGGVVVVGKNKELADQIAFLQNSVGAIAGAFDSFLVLRSLKTLALRLERHCSNALEIARWLEEQREVKSVHYPGLKSHLQHDLARQQMRGFGGMVTIVLKTDLAGTRRFLENTHLFALAESLGGVESLINHPALMTHASVPEEQRQKLGITDSLVRLSVGVEDVRDLIDDLKSALEAI